MKRFKAIAVFFLISIELYAQYSYEDLKVMMMKNNYELKAAEADAYMAKLDRKDAEGAIQPTVEFQSTGLFLANPPIGKIAINTSDLGLGLPPSDIVIYDGMEHNYYSTSLSITQPLVTWGKIPNAISMQKDIEGAKNIAIEDTKNRLECELKALLATSYYLEEAKSMAERIATVSDELSSFAYDAKNEGLIVEDEERDANIEALRASLVFKEIEKEQNDIILRLRELTGINDLSVDNMAYIPDYNEIIKWNSYSKNEVKALATGGDSKTLQMLSRKISAYEHSHSIAISSMYGIPDFALKASLGYSGPRVTFIEDDWMAKNDWGLNVTIGFKTTLWDGGTKLNNLRRTENMVAQAKNDYSHAKSALELNASNYYDSFMLSEKKVEILSSSVENCQNRMKRMNMLYEEGYISKKEVLEAELDLLSEQLSLVQEKITLANSSYMLSYITNMN